MWTRLLLLMVRSKSGINSPVERTVVEIPWVTRVSKTFQVLFFEISEPTINSMDRTPKMDWRTIIPKGHPVIHPWMGLEDPKTQRPKVRRYRNFSGDMSKKIFRSRNQSRFFATATQTQQKHGNCSETSSFCHPNHHWKPNKGTHQRRAVMGHPTRDPWWVLVPSTVAENCPEPKKTPERKNCGQKWGEKFKSNQKKPQKDRSFCALFLQSSWWFQPIWNILVKLDHFPK